MEVALLVLSVSVLVSLIFIGTLYSKNIGLQKIVSDMKQEVEKTKQAQEELVSIDAGDKAILPNYGLTYADKEDFKVTYEVEILEVSIDKVKVKAVDFTSTDKIARDPKNRNGIIEFMNGKWVNKRDIELVVDDQMRRDKKIKQILG
jgi:hypothetical protein